MVERQLRRRDVEDERVLAAMARVPRELFLPTERRDQAYDDAALPIEGDQTMSQPYIVAKMCETPRSTATSASSTSVRSGYHAAVLRGLAEEVVTIERVQERARARRSSPPATATSTIRIGDGTLGVPDRAPYHAIAVAAARAVLPSLYDQLKIGGRMVVPVGGRANQRLRNHRQERGPAVVRSVPCRFVPLVGKEGFSE